MSNSYYGTSSRSSARAKARALAAPEREERWRRGIIYLLPAVLIIVTAVVTGCYFENADDLILALLTRGNLTAQPVGALHVGMYGLSYLLAGLYGILPKVPWYAVLLYSALYLALMLHTALLQRLTRRLLT
ncbi:MAG: hypothetical protein H7330_09265, partial [Hymenobacteraceae bacterium]|nr:hypothetical protein [Hymenobacteraceae bacterium]